VFLFSIISHFYIKESISTLKINNEHLISCYANRVTTHKQSIKEFKELVFGTLESFKYKVAIINSKNKLLYTTFDRTPLYDFSNRTYIKDDKVYYNGIKDFSDAGNVKIIFSAALDYSEIKKKVIILLISSLVFLIACSLFLRHHLTDIYTNISKKLDLFFKDAIHEIRTPLGVIQINLDFLENTMENSMPLKRAQGGVRNLTSVYEGIEYSIKHKKVK
jgi:two-component system OmpR family sensor kinase